MVDAATTTISIKPGMPRFKRRNVVQVFIRIFMFIVMMALNYPFLLLAAFFRALYQRAVKGKVSAILHSVQLPYNHSGIAGLRMIPDFYPCQLVLSQPLVVDKLQPIFTEMCAEAGININESFLEFNTETPAAVPASGPLESNQYVKPKDCPDNWNQLMRVAFGKYIIAIRVFNGEPGSPTVLHACLPGGAWDGTSCFNFMKELVNRYYGDKNDVFQGKKLTMTKAAKEKLDANSNFCSFMCRLPWAIWQNTTSMMWGVSGTAALLGGPGMSFRNVGLGEFRYTLINFDEADSKALTAGLKAKGKKPFAGFIHAAVASYRSVLGANPYGVVMQASLQTRAYEPVVKERNLVGDWLIGPLQKIKSGVEYTLDTAQAKYERLLASMENLDGDVLHAAEARAYGVINGGAAMCEVMPFYPDHQRVWSGVFFNNYGLRTIHPDAGCISFNWGAPFMLGFNTICVNGRTCICLASSLMSLEKLQAIRDKSHDILREYIEAGKDGANNSAPLAVVDVEDAQVLPVDDAQVLPIDVDGAEVAPQEEVVAPEVAAPVIDQN